MNLFLTLPSRKKGSLTTCKQEAEGLHRTDNVNDKPVSYLPYKLASMNMLYLFSAKKRRLCCKQEGEGLDGTCNWSEPEGGPPY